MTIDFREVSTKVSYELKEFKHKKGQPHRPDLEQVFKCLEFVGGSVDKIGTEIHKELKLGHFKNNPNSSKLSKPQRASIK